MPEKTFYESLKCILTDDEKQKLGSDMAEAVARIAESEADLKSFQTQIKAKVAAIKAKVAADEAVVMTCSEKICSGYEFRRVECEEVKDYERNEVNVIRLDNYGFVRTRKMEPGERQKNLPLKEETKGDNGGQPVEVMQEV